MTRKLFGKHFPILGGIYRSVFVDLGAVAQSISPHIPPQATIIDIGGGGGAPINYLLSLRDDIRVSIIDPSPRIGNSIKKEYLTKVNLYPATSMDEFSKINRRKPDVILISDVIHHIPCKNRKDFFAELVRMVDGTNGIRIIIKDVEPGYFRSLLGGIADRYISGDKNVSLVGRADISYMMLEAFGDTITAEETNLFDLDKPNFALVFTIPGS